jgi:alkylation response protein AidB-like acyl-CoA dehydrogenase
MDIDLTEEQRELQRIAREVVERSCPPSLVRSAVEDGVEPDDLWKQLVAMEWPGLTISLEEGGSGASALDLALVLEQLGWAADPTPFLATTTQHLPLVRDCLAGSARAERLAAIAGGSPGAAILEAGAITAVADGDGWVLTGSAEHVFDGDRAEALAVVADTPAGPGVFLVPAADVTATRTDIVDGSLHVALVALDGVPVPAERSATGPDLADRIAVARDEALIGLAAATVGAAQRALDLALEHIKERQQFGVPIGSFQALKHMAVDAHLALERARSTMRFAALTVAIGDDALRPMAAAIAKAAAGDAQRIACQHGIQFFGGLGYTWENDLHLFVRRAKVGDMLLGGAHGHRLRVAELAMAKAAKGEPPLRLAFDDATEAYRAEFGAWLDANQPTHEEALTERSRSSSHVPGWARAWQRKMFEAGWLVPGNPPEYGGRNASVMEQFVFHEELSRRRIYQSYNPQGLSIIVPSILAYGTEEQKQRWALPIMRAEITASLGMSEPDAGSDLAGLRTRAVLDGDRFIVNGQKVWTSGAHDADVIFAFVRTDPDAPKHKGISVLLVPTDTPGLTRRPFGSLKSPDDLDFNEVFFDDVEVPAENLVGELNQGWSIATGSLGHERAMLWLGYAERLDDLILHGPLLEEVGLGEDAFVLDWYAQLVIDAQALQLLGHRTLAEVARGAQPSAQSILKLLGSEASQRATLHMLEAIGPRALDPDERSSAREPLNLDVWTDGWFDRYLGSFAATIAGGTSQIQRNIIAEHVLGLPR